MPDLPTPSTLASRAAAREAEGRPAHRAPLPREVELIDAGTVVRDVELVGAPLVSGADIEVTR